MRRDGVIHRQCWLCLKYAELQDSHIIPKFVVNWFKNSAPGYFRSGRSPNLRLQDAFKQHLLCWDCEQLFSSWETTFSENIFSPLHRETPPNQSIAYGPWALKFAASVSWRVLLYCIDLGIPYLTPEQRIAASQAKEIWRRFLLGEIQHPRQFEQHLLPMDAVDDNRLFQGSPFINRYLLSTLDIDVVAWDRSVLVYAKLGRLLLFGLIQDENRQVWKGTKLHVRRGVIQSELYEVPSSIFNYIGERANQTAKAASSLSPRQKKKVEQIFNEDFDKVKASEFFRGLRYDVAASGKAALVQVDPEGNEKSA